MTGRRGPEDRDADPRSDLQQIVESRKDEVEASGGGDTKSDIADSGTGGAEGVVKDQDIAPGSPTGSG